MRRGHAKGKLFALASLDSPAQAFPRATATRSTSAVQAAAALPVMKAAGIKAE